MSENPLSALKIDAWYKIIPVLGSVLLVLALTVELQDVSNTMVQISSLGLIAVGIGEWINHPLQTKLGLGYKILIRNKVSEHYPEI